MSGCFSATFASARSIASSMSPVSRRPAASPARVRSIFRSEPSTEPNATCSARAGGTSHPASFAAWNTIVRCTFCGAPTT